MKSKIIFGTLVIATTTWLVVGMAQSASATDCKYVKTVVLSDNGSILSSTTNYVCKESQPIVILSPTTITVQKYKRQRPMSFRQIRNTALGY